MAFNSRPVRAITDEDRAAYARDGAVCLRNVFDRDWIDSLLPIARRLLVDGEDFGLLPHVPGSWMARKIPEFREFAFRSPIGEAAGRALGSQWVRFFVDIFFAKPPRSTAATPWHSDRSGWPFSGTMIPSFWMPLTPVSRANGLEVIAGSHRQDLYYWNITAMSKKMIRPPDRLNIPDAETVRGDPNYTFLGWDMEPGDALLIHPWALHYSSGNSTDDWRIALTVRLLGDDTRWDPRPECVGLAGVSLDEMVPGEVPDTPFLPVIWSADGRTDPMETYPTGFATRWSASARPRLKAERAKAPTYMDEVKRFGGQSSMKDVERVS
ncbi:MAG: phytanoyl-CoA dioxygenase family protein [Rhodospirillaceae bacterium]|nr:phytanoyl-CoA dioxygenase family protein [Rhodospirillaceae bacterium]